MAENVPFNNLRIQDLFGGIPAVRLDSSAYSLKANASVAGKLAAHDAAAHLLAVNTLFSDIKILNKDSGRPYAEIAEDLWPVLAKNGIVDIPVSIAHDGGIALGIAAAETNATPGLRVGMDVTTLERMEKTLRGGIKRLMTSGEIDEINDDAVELARRFTAKEAIMKVYGTGNSHGMYFRNIITHIKEGEMSIELKDEALTHQERLGFNHIHIRHAQDQNFVAAFVLAHK